MPFMFPYSGAMRILGGVILLSTIVNALLKLREVGLWGHDLYSGWYFDWSPVFIFVGLLLVVGSLWTDPRVVIVLAGVLAILWYIYIVLGGL